MVYGSQNINIQRHLSQELLDQIFSNFHSLGRNKYYQLTKCGINWIEENLYF